MLTLPHCSISVQKRLISNTHSGGIGSACARGLAANGLDVALHYSSSKVRVSLLYAKFTANPQTCS